MFGKVLLLLGFVLTLAQSSLATDYYATPSGAGLQNGTSWANAYSQSQIDGGTLSVVDSVMLAGDTLHLGSGTYSQPIHLSSSGTASSPKKIIGEDSGGGLPLMDMGNWSPTTPGTGNNRAIGFGSAASYWTIENLIIQDVVHGIRTDNLDTGQYIGIILRSLSIQNCQHPVVINDANGWVIEKITATQYTKHGFRLDHNCQNIILRHCIADLSGGDETWYDHAEVYPFGFLVEDPTGANFGAGPANADITFEDCLAQHHRMMESKQIEANPYWNGDGFVINSGGNTGLYRFIRCRALDNEDGGFDIKPPSELIDCVAFQNSRNFRFHTGNASMTNCVSGYPTKRGGTNGLVGVWVHNPTVTMSFCTIHSVREKGVEEDSAGQVTLTDSIISFEESVTTTHSGSVTLGSGTVIFEPGVGVNPEYVNSHSGWDGVGTDMNSNTYGTSKGYFQNPDSGDADHRIVPTNIAPTIDGSVDSKWNSANSQTIANVVVGAITDNNDLSGSFRTLWDSTNLYVLVEVNDEAARNDSGITQTWDDDSVEIYIDANNNKPSTYDSDDYLYRFTWNGSSLGILETKHTAITGVSASRATTATGYVIEVKLPWNTLGQSSVAFGALLGLDVHINDDDDGGSRDGKKSWFNTADTSWQNPGTFATAMLQADYEAAQTSTSPSIDGNVETSWNSADSKPIANIVLGSVTDNTDLSGSFRTLWDGSNLYVLVQINDDAQQNDSGTQSWNDDSVEIYIDANNDKPTSYGGNDYRYHFVWNGSSVTIKELQHNAVAGVVAARVATATGYTIEVQLPWSTLGQSGVAVNALFGLDVHINDDDDGGSRDGKKAWFNTVDTSWQNPSAFATARLVGLP